MEFNEEILEGNKLLARFMGYEYYAYNDPRLIDGYMTHVPGWKTTVYASDIAKLNRVEGLLNRETSHFLCRSHTGIPYYNDWNQLMKVVEKIEKLGYTISIVGDKCKSNDLIVVTFPAAKIVEKKKYATWRFCVEFVKWYKTDKYDS